MIQHLENLAERKVICVFNLVQRGDSVCKQRVNCSFLLEHNVDLLLGHKVDEIAQSTLILAVVVAPHIAKDLLSLALADQETQFVETFLELRLRCECQRIHL
jgi:hypothetical protein